MVYFRHLLINFKCIYFKFAKKEPIFPLLFHDFPLILEKNKPILPISTLKNLSNGPLYERFSKETRD